MFLTLRNRLILVGVLVVAAILALIPRKQTVRELRRGRRHARHHGDPPAAQVRARPPGRHAPGLELDQSKQVSADPKQDIDLALTVLRKRIDEFGVTEPVVQKVGDDRIVVELAGVADPERAKAIVQKSAFLEFRITDKTGALDKALPAMDRQLRSDGRVQRPARPRPGRRAVTQLLGGDSAKKGDRLDADAAAGDPRRPDPRAGSAAPGRVPRRRDGVPPGGQPAQPAGGEARSCRAASRSSGRPARMSVGGEFVRCFYVVEDQPLVTGRQPGGRAAPSSTRSPTARMVTFELDRAGGRKFGEGTGRHVGDYMAIVLDGRVQGRPPVIQSRIDRNGQITLRRQDAAGGAGPGADAQGRRAAGPAQDRRVGPGRARASAPTRSRAASWPASSARCS